jgi:dihydroorotate dehydrogenase (NAD+) catalytic subunit
MLNAIGLQNEGLDFFLQNLLPPLRKRAARVIVNIAGKTEDDYLALARGFDASGVDALEVNISCPNVKVGGMAFGTSAATAGALTAKLRAATTLPLWVKLSPNVTSIAEIAQAVEEAGADALTVANTFLGMAIDIEKRRPILGNVTGGLSGPCVHPLILRLVWQVRQAVRIPIVAVGGVRSVREVVAFLLAGASAVEVGTMNFVEPDLCGRLVSDLDAWCESHKTTVGELIGALALSEKAPC